MAAPAAGRPTCAGDLDDSPASQTLWPAGQRPYQPRGTPYPALAAQRSNQVHPLDLVGPRYLKGGERFYGVQLMDAYCNAVALAAMPSKQAIDVVEAKELIKNG
jgi:hypothetical protein